MTSMHFWVPNNRRGRTFLENLRCFKNSEAVGTILNRPRGSRAAASAEGFHLNADRDMPSTSKHVTGWAVYLRESKTREKITRDRRAREREFWKRHYDQRGEKAVREFLVGERTTLNDQIDTLNSHATSQAAVIKDQGQGLMRARSGRADAQEFAIEMSDGRTRAEFRLRRTIYLAAFLGFMAVIGWAGHFVEGW